MKRGCWLVAAWKSPLSQHAKAILSPWKGCDRKGEECGERIVSGRLKFRKEVRKKVI